MSLEAEHSEPKVTGWITLRVKSLPNTHAGVEELRVQQKKIGRQARRRYHQ